MAQDKRRPQKKQAPTKIKKYRKPLNLNIGMIIFGAILIYVIICVVMYFKSNNIGKYEVKEGSLSTNNIYEGVALRNETVVNSETAGYVNYYAREGERVAKGDLVYTIDETGKLKDYMETAVLGENTLSDRELAQFRNEIVSFMHGFDLADFHSAYDFKYSMKGTVLKLANSNMMENIGEVSQSAGVSETVNFSRAQATGIVAYWTDGLEGLTADQVTEEILGGKTVNGEPYEKKQLIGNELMETGQAAYKVSTSENWSVVIPVEEARGQELAEAEYVKVRFLKNQYESWGAVTLLHNGDGKTYAKLDFNNSMLTFISDRFVDVELIMNDNVGLKIPNTSIVQKEFFLVPEEYVTKGGDNGRDGVIRQCYLEDGTISSEFVETDLYYLDEETKEYYMDTLILGIGDTLIQPESQATYAVSKKAALIGVYNINKGYADFRQINILQQNEEYAIVQSNTKYGLNVYDYIVLNADAVSDDQLIYE